MNKNIPSIDANYCPTKKDEIKNAVDDNVCFSQVPKDQVVTKSNFVLAEEKGEADNHHHKEEEETVVKEVSFY